MNNNIKKITHRFVFTSTIPEIQDALKKAMPLMDIIPHAGECYLVGDWNNWGDSPEKAGCIRLNSSKKMVLSHGLMIADCKLTPGAHEFKLAFPRAAADENEMVPCDWVGCPPDGYLEYTSSGKNNNFRVVIK